MFTERAKTIALAIVKIFETSQPFGRYDAVAVLDDGAGISYGTSQFTHKSGSLADVIERYLKLNHDLPTIIDDALPDLKAGRRIAQHSGDVQLKSALKKLGKDPLMQQAQREIAFENYLKPALAACEGSHFTYPMSLAVIYDSMNHGSYAKIRDKVKVNMPGNGSMKPEEFEKEWIKQYVQKRDAWLESVPRLKKTDYRTDFFLAQIGRDNWNLNLPLNVHGFKLTEEILFPSSTVHQTATSTTNSHDVVDPADNTSKQTEAQTMVEPSIPQTQIAETIVNTGATSTAPVPDGNPVTVTVERVSIWAKLGAGFAGLTGLGINFATVIENKLNEINVVQLGYALGALGLIAVALYLYDRAAKRAHEKTLAKVETASDPAKNTVELREQTK